MELVIVDDKCANAISFLKCIALANNWRLDSAGVTDEIESVAWIVSDPDENVKRKSIGDRGERLVIDPELIVDSVYGASLEEGGLFSAAGGSGHEDIDQEAEKRKFREKVKFYELYQDEEEGEWQGIRDWVEKRLDSRDALILMDIKMGAVQHERQFTRGGDVSPLCRCVVNELKGKSRFMIALTTTASNGAQIQHNLRRQGVDCHSLPAWDTRMLEVGGALRDGDIDYAKDHMNEWWAELRQKWAELRYREQWVEGDADVNRALELFYRPYDQEVQDAPKWPRCWSHKNTQEDWGRLQGRFRQWLGLVDREIGYEVGKALMMLPDKVSEEKVLPIKDNRDKRPWMHLESQYNPPAIKSDILSRIFVTMGMPEVEVERDKYFVLPVCPGLPFLVSIKSLIRSLSSDGLGNDQGHKGVSVRQRYLKGKTQKNEIEICLLTERENNGGLEIIGDWGLYNAYIKTFFEGWDNKEGSVVDALYLLKTCSVKMARGVGESTGEWLKYFMSPPEGGHHLYYVPINISFRAAKLVVSWGVGDATNIV